MEFSTEAIAKIAEIMVAEIERIGSAKERIGKVETTMREFLRAVGIQALEQYLEEKDEQFCEAETVCGCGETMKYLFKRQATILSVFGRVRYRRGYHICERCHTGQSPLDREMGIEAGQVTAGLAELLALAGV